MDPKTCVRDPKRKLMDCKRCPGDPTRGSTDCKRSLRVCARGAGQHWTAVALLLALGGAVPGADTQHAHEAWRNTVTSVLEVGGQTHLLDRVLQLFPPLDDNVTSASILATFGYPTEAHYTTTKDGYRLRIDRVANPGRQPVFLAHGMQTSSPSFALLGKGKALATLLHDAGYDVWMINYRGTHYSQNHTKYTVSDDRFWRFSLHEHGVFDNPAAIDLVLQRTGFPSVLYACHSMGCTSFMIMAAERPAYQQKVQATFLMAPAGPLHHHRSPFVRLLYTFNNITQPLVNTLRLNPAMRPTYLLLRRIGSLAPKWLFPLLYAFTFTIVGTNPEANYYSLPFFFNTIPSGGSWEEIFHYVQNANPNLKGFRQYDHGPRKNLKLYGSRVPPEYNLSKISVPSHFYLAYNDVLCTPEDAEFLTSQFRTVAQVHFAENPVFNHFDFFGSASAVQEVYQPMIKHMKLFENARRDPGLHKSLSEGDSNLVKERELGISLHTYPPSVYSKFLSDNSVQAL